MRIWNEAGQISVQIQGQFLAQFNTIFEGFVLEAVQHSYRVSGEPTPATELLISNIHPNDRNQGTMEL